MNLLLVDDEILALDALEKAVRKVLPGETISTFNKATQAMEFAKGNRIDIAFLDIDMRILNGLKMAKELQMINPRTNIIFVTGFAEYALDAFSLYASAYLTKPVKAEDIAEAVTRLRYPPEEKKVRFHCFGNFEVYFDNRPVTFSLTKTKELLAYLVDRDGAECRKNEIIAALFEDDFNVEYYKKIRKDLILTFSELGAGDVIHVTHGGLAINKSGVICDYFEYLQGDRKNPPSEYMEQYSFAENTFASLSGKQK